MKIYLVLMNRETKTKWTKYFDSLYAKNCFKDKLKYSKKILIIEDSEDIFYGEGALLWEY